MKKITFLLILLITSIGYSQTNLEDFEGTPDLAGFEGLGGANIVANPSVDGNNGSATVGELIVVQAGQPWQGANLVMQSNYIDVSDPVAKPVTAQVYSTTTFNMLARLSDAQNGATESAAAATHGGTGWETLTFTFNENLDNTGTANGEYGIIAFFPNWNGSGWHDPEIEITVHIDNITAFPGASLDTCGNGVQDGDETGVDCGGSCDTVCLTTAAPTPPARAAADVISIYGEAYGTAIGLNNVPWDGGTDSVEETIAGNNVLKVSFDTFLGTDLGSIVDATDMTHFHMDYFIADPFETGQVFNLKWSNHTGGSGETNAGELIIELPASGALNQTWISVDVPLTDWTAGINPRESLAQFLITAAGLIDLAYVDNIYFHKNTTLSTDSESLIQTRIFPNPSANGWSVSTPNTIITSVEVFNLLGKRVAIQKANSNNITVSTDGMASGIYIAKINTELGTKTVKLLRD